MLINNYTSSLVALTLYLLFLGGGGGKGSGNSNINELCHYITDYIITNIFAHIYLQLMGGGLLLVLMCAGATFDTMLISVLVLQCLETGD